jgi:hypothetical protein
MLQADVQHKAVCCDPPFLASSWADFSIL